MRCNESRGVDRTLAGRWRKIERQGDSGHRDTDRGNGGSVVRRATEPWLEAVCRQGWYAEWVWGRLGMDGCLVRRLRLSGVAYDGWGWYPMSGMAWVRVSCGYGDGIQWVAGLVSKMWWLGTTCKLDARQYVDPVAPEPTRASPRPARQKNKRDASFPFTPYSSQPQQQPPPPHTPPKATRQERLGTSSPKPPPPSSASPNTPPSHSPSYPATTPAPTS